MKIFAFIAFFTLAIQGCVADSNRALNALKHSFAQQGESIRKVTADSKPAVNALKHPLAQQGESIRKFKEDSKPALYASKHPLAQEQDESIRKINRHISDDLAPILLRERNDGRRMQATCPTTDLDACGATQECLDCVLAAEDAVFASNSVTCLFLEDSLCLAISSTCPCSAQCEGPVLDYYECLYAPQCTTPWTCEAAPCLQDQTLFYNTCSSECATCAATELLTSLETFVGTTGTCDTLGSDICTGIYQTCSACATPTCQSLAENYNTCFVDEFCPSISCSAQTPPETTTTIAPPPEATTTVAPPPAATTTVAPPPETTTTVTAPQTCPTADLDACGVTQECLDCVSAAEDAVFTANVRTCTFLEDSLCLAVSSTCPCSTQCEQPLLDYYECLYAEPCPTPWTCETSLCLSQQTEFYNTCSSECASCTADEVVASLDNFAGCDTLGSDTCRGIYQSCSACATTNCESVAETYYSCAVNDLCSSISCSAQTPPEATTTVAPPVDTTTTVAPPVDATTTVAPPPDEPGPPENRSPSDINDGDGDDGSNIVIIGIAVAAGAAVVIAGLGFWFCTRRNGSGVAKNGVSADSTNSGSSDHETPVQSVVPAQPGFYPPPQESMQMAHVYGVEPQPTPVIYDQREPGTYSIDI